MERLDPWMALGLLVLIGGGSVVGASLIQAISYWCFLRRERQYEEELRQHQEKLRHAKLGGAEDRDDTTSQRTSVEDE